MRKKKLILGSGAFVAGALLLFANPNPPEWWTEAGVSGTSSPASPANLGQVKHMAHKFHEELDGVLTPGEMGLPGGAGFPLVEVFPKAPDSPSPAWLADQLRVANLGQLKHVASFYYERLNTLAPDWVVSQMDANGIASGWSHPVPWDPDTPVEDNHVIATLGQLKMVFSLRPREDSDGDLIPDLIEHILYGKHIGEDGDDKDFDGDGLFDQAEIVIHQTSPYESDSDGDGFTDGEEIANQTNPNVAEGNQSPTTVTQLAVLTPLWD